MRTRTLVTGLIGVGVGIGWLINQYIPDFGSGGIGFGPGGADTAVTTTADSAAGQSPAIVSTPEAVPETPPETLGGPGNTAPVVYVLLDGRDFFIRTKGGEKPEYRRASLGEILAAAHAAKGDEDGLRVRIARKQSARATTEQQLRAGLQQAGFSPEAIRWDEDPVP